MSSPVLPIALAEENDDHIGHSREEVVIGFDGYRVFAGFVVPDVEGVPDARQGDHVCFHCGS